MDYEVEIIATLADTDSNLSGFTRFKTNPVPPEIQLETITSTSVEFGWTAVPDTEIYSIAITTADGGQQRTSEVSGKTTNFEFYDLEHWKEYTITVTARQILDSFTGDVKFRTSKFCFTDCPIRSPGLGPVASIRDRPFDLDIKLIKKIMIEHTVSLLYSK